MATVPLNGPGVAPASGRPARQLVVFLHGVGADGDDLIGLAPYFAHRLPDAEFLAPHAPFPFDMAPMGRQWFSLEQLAPQALLDGVLNAAPSLEAYLDRELAARGLTEEQLALVGFSQGTMMALHVTLRRPAACAAVVGYSGLLVGPEQLPGEITARPPVLLVHGKEDEVIPYEFLALTKSALEAAGVPVTALSCPEFGHSISDEGLTAGIDFVARRFGPAPKGAA